jgi:hypothetical protein
MENKAMRDAFEAYAREHYDIYSKPESFQAGAKWQAAQARPALSEDEAVAVMLNSRPLIDYERELTMRLAYRALLAAQGVQPNADKERIKKLEEALLYAAAGNDALVAAIARKALNEQKGGV